MSRYDVIVVGGGAMGAATAHAVARSGRAVALVEQFEAAHDRGSSHGSSRIFRLAYPSVHHVRLAQRALRLWRRLEDDAQASLLVQTGGIDHGEAAAVAAVEEGLAAAGAPSTRLRADEAGERWPGMQFGTDVLLQPDAGRVDADATVIALHKLAARHGAQVSCAERVAAVRSSAAGVEVVTERRTLQADVAVVAAGAWLPSLPVDPALPLPSLRVTQEQPAYFPAATGETWPVFVHHGDAVRYGLFTPGLGMKVGEHGTGQPVDPDARVPVDEGAVRRLSAYVEQWLPGAGAAPTRVDSCLYTTTPDEEFLLRRHGRVVVCSACSGHGFKFTPAIGERAAALALS